MLTKTNEQYINFARKYRPTNFSQVYGQEVLTKTLSYSILNNRISQSYLLTGIRGVGKTTSARIIAKTISCTDLITEDKTIKPCEVCQNCLQCNKNNHPDIIEIDAASKTSVDDIRRIIESSEYKPLIGKYSIFIIDEVHMLSKGAFNALLKILEEPPTHVIFIFATTEPQKMPLTVASRCQRYDLRRLTFEEIFQLLQEVAAKEKIKIETEALKIIAARSDGSAREAILALDQASSFEERDIITASTVCKMLGLVDTKIIIKFCKYIVNQETAKALNLLNNLYMLSANLEIFITLAADFIAYLTKVKLLPDYKEPIYESFVKEITVITQQVTFPKLSIIWQIFSKGVAEIKISHNQLIEAEMLTIKSIHSQMLPSPQELVAVYNEELQNQPEQLTSSRNITDFLDYLYLQNEIEIYYLLLNEVEWKAFSLDIIEIAGDKISMQIKEKIANLLLKWSGKNYNIIVSKQSMIIPLKEKLIGKVKVSDNWKMLEKHFPDITISDIVLFKTQN